MARGVNDKSKKSDNINISLGFEEPSVSGKKITASSFKNKVNTLNNIRMQGCVDSCKCSMMGTGKCQ